MSRIRSGKSTPIKRPEGEQLGLKKKAETSEIVVKAKVDAGQSTVDDNKGAKAALRALALDTKSPERKAGTNSGAEAATLGAKLMGFMKSEGGKKAYAALGLGISLMGMVQPASAQVVQVGQGSEVQQAAQKIAQETGEPFVQVNAEKEALEGVFAKAESGELEMKHLILNYDEGKLPSSYDWQNLKSKYPKAFEQVEQVHVIGHNLQDNPLKSYQGDVFPNAKAIVSFDLSTALSPKPASAWVLEHTTQALKDVPADGLSAQDALIHAKTIASKGAEGGVRTRVDIAGQNHVQAPENKLSEWLEAEQKGESPGVTSAELEAKLKELAGSEEGLTDQMLGVLQSKMGERNFKMDYDATRLGTHLIDVQRAAGPEVALKALTEGKVHQVRHELATASTTTAYAQERSELFKTEITRGVPMAGNEAIPTGGLQGTAYLVDGLGSIKNGEVNVQAIHHPKHGDGYQLTFKLGDNAGAKLEDWLKDQKDSRLVDKTIVNFSPTEDGRVVTAEKGDVEEPTGVVDNQRPEMSIGPALRYQKEGKFRVDYFPESLAKQSLRGEVQVQVYGKSDSQRNDRLRDVMKELGLRDVVEGKPSEETEDKFKALRLLEQSDPRAHHAMMDRIEKGENVGISELHDALIAAEVPPAFLQQAYFSEAAPGHMSVIVPGQSEAYARRGVRSVYHTISKAEIFAYIANDGALMSTKDRLQVGKVFRGMSSDTDLRTGGADYVFTRQVTAPMGNPSMSQMRGGAIVMKPDVLDRADWFAYSGDQYGTTLSGDRGEITDSVKEVMKRTFDELKEKGDSSVQSKDFDGWMANMLRAQTDSRENSFLPRPVGTAQVTTTTGSSNETMLEGTIPISQIESFLVRTQEDKDTTVNKMKELGVTEINGVKVEDFIQVRDKFFSEEQMQMFDATPSDKVGTEQDKKEQENRLQFYVRHEVKVPGASQETFVA